MTNNLVSSETDTQEISVSVDEAARAEYTLKISVSMPTISKICFNYLETVEEDNASWDLKNWLGLVVHSLLMFFSCINYFLECYKRKFLSFENLKTLNLEVCVCAYTKCLKVYSGEMQHVSDVTRQLMFKPVKSGICPWCRG